MRSSPICCLIALVGLASSTPHAVKRATLSNHDSEHKIPHKYTVELREGYTLEQHIRHTGTNLTELPHFYAFTSSNAYMAEIVDSKLLHDVIRLDPGVSQVDCHETSPRSLPSIDEAFAEGPSLLDNSDNATSLVKRASTYAVNVILPATWNLQVVGASEKLHDISYGHSLNEVYNYYDSAGAGVDVYVLDSGVFIGHDYFQGRATNFNNAVPNDKSPYVDETYVDFEGHGTKMAGIIGAYYFGVAPSANIISVKVTGKGRTSDRIAQAIEDVTKRHFLRLVQPGDISDFRGSVINMSFGINDTPRLRAALVAAKKAGIELVASAGNDNSDNDMNKVYPCGYHGTVDCVAGINQNYQYGESMNFGSDIGWLAPGVGIWTLGNDLKSPKGLVKGTGSSEATACVSGNFAIYSSWLGLVNGQAANWAQREALFDQVDMGGIKSSANRLINTGIRHKSKRPGEPFYGAGDKRSILRTTPYPNTGPIYPPNQDANPNGPGPDPVHIITAPIAKE